MIASLLSILPFLSTSHSFHALTAVAVVTACTWTSQAALSSSLMPSQVPQKGAAALAQLMHMKLMLRAAAGPAATKEELSRLLIKKVLAVALHTEVLLMSTQHPAALFWGLMYLLGSHQSVPPLMAPSVTAIRTAIQAAAAVATAAAAVKAEALDLDLGVAMRMQPHSVRTVSWCPPALPSSLSGKAVWRSGWWRCRCGCMCEWLCLFFV
jgi:hypothetical protein